MSSNCFIDNYNIFGGFDKADIFYCTILYNLPIKNPQQFTRTKEKEPVRINFSNESLELKSKYFKKTEILFNFKSSQKKMGK